MAKLLKLRRGTTSQHGSFTGAEGEVTVDTDKETLVVHDGSTAGGHPVAAEDMANVSSASIVGRLGTGSIVKAKLEADIIDGTKLADDAVDSDHIAAGAVDLEHMSSESVDEDNLKISNAGTNGQFLSKQSGNTGGLTWATPSTTATEATNVTVSANNSTDETVYPTFVDGATGAQGIETDTGLTYNPSTGLLTTAAVTTTGNITVGGNLQVDGTTTTVNSSTMTVTDKNIEIAKGAANDAAADGAGITVDSGDGDKTWNWVDATDAWTSSEHIHLGDSKKVILGTDSDLNIYHSGSHGFIDNSLGNLDLKAQQVGLYNYAGDEVLAKFTANGAVELYYNNFKALETIDNGVYVYGPEGTDAFIYLYADEGDDNADKYWLKTAQDGTGFYIQNFVAGSPAETSLRAVGGGTTELYHDNAKRIETTSAGVTVTGSVTDSKGDVRNIPRNIQASAYTLVASDAGKAIRLASGGITIPSSVMDVGEAVTIINHSSSDQTITQGSGLTMYNSADGSTGNRTLAGRGMATIWFDNDARCYISGAGLS